MTGDDRSRRRRNWLRLSGVAAASGGVLVLGVYAFERWSLHADQNLITFNQPAVDPFLKFVMPGIQRPPVVVASKSKLRPDERVIGFVVAGRARAYRLESLRDRSKHVVNDVVGEIPISVSFCDINNCIRAYTGRAGQGPLDVAVGGMFRGEEMILNVGGTLYFQETGKAFRPTTATGNLPLDPIEPTLTTWAEWSRDHPETEVYEGIK